MFTSSSYSGNYQRIGIESGVASSDPYKLILMLFEGAEQALNRCKYYIRKNEVAAKGEMISKAIMIIDHGLKASLDTKTGGELAERLSQLYDYMTHRLLEANIQNNLEIVEEVSQLLSELHTAWAAIKQTTVCGAV